MDECVVVGPNFAATIVGGVVYIGSPEDAFCRLLNSATVDLVDASTEDLIFVKSKIEEFVKLTGSELGQRIIGNWQREHLKIIKVFPRDYKRELAGQEDACKKKAELEKANQDMSLLSVDDSKPRTRTLSMDMQIAPTIRTHKKTKEALRKKSLLGDNCKPCRLSKSSRPQDLAGFENEEDLQDAAHLEEEEDNKSDLDDHSDEEEFGGKESILGIENLAVPPQLRMKDEPLDKLRGFVKYNHQKKFYRDPKESLNDWDEVYDFGAIRSNIREQAARCMDCGVPFCQEYSGCSLGNIIPKWNDFVFKKNWRQALEHLLQTNNFPEFTGRVYPTPCEGACTLGIGIPAVTIKSIDCAITDYAFMQGWMKLGKPAFNTGKRIAIIGFVPSGLGAAAQLIKVGHTVVVYERKNRVGGLLRYGIPTMKLDKFVVDRRVILLEQEGVRFLTNTEIGKHVPAVFMLKENDAIIVCTGSATARDLTVEGRQAKGICFAMEFLEESQRRRAGDDIGWEGLDPANKKVIILGGGDTATDCIATSNRLGCKTVEAFEILPQPGPNRKPENPWPEWPLIFRVDYGHEKAKEKTGSDPRTYSVPTKRFLTTTNDAGIEVLTGLEIVDVEWEKDEKGAWKLVEKTETIRTIECDLCILAMGFVGPEKTVIEQLNLKTDPRSNILTPKDNYEAQFKSEDNSIIGNVAHYGATSGDCWFRGVAGERCAVRDENVNRARGGGGPLRHNPRPLRSCRVKGGENEEKGTDAKIGKNETCKTGQTGHKSKNMPAPPLKHTVLTIAQFSEHWVKGTWTEPGEIANRQKEGVPILYSHFLLYQGEWMCSVVMSMWLDRRVKLNPAVTHLDHSMANKRNFASLVARALKTHTTILLPLIVRNDHWVLLSICDYSIEYYDPIHDEPGTEAKEVFRKLKNKLVTEKFGEQVPKQRDGHSCGIYVARMALSIITGDEWVTKNCNRDVNNFRKQFCEELSQDYQIKPEPSRPLPGSSSQSPNLSSMHMSLPTPLLTPIHSPARVPVHSQPSPRCEDPAPEVGESCFNKNVTMRKRKHPEPVDREAKRPNTEQQFVVIGSVSNSSSPLPWHRLADYLHRLGTPKLPPHTIKPAEGIPTRLQSKGNEYFATFVLTCNTSISKYENFLASHKPVHFGENQWMQVAIYDKKSYNARLFVHQLYQKLSFCEREKFGVVCKKEIDSGDLIKCMQNVEKAAAEETYRTLGGSIRAFIKWATADGIPRDYWPNEKQKPNGPTTKKTK